MWASKKNPIIWSFDYEMSLILFILLHIMIDLKLLYTHLEAATNPISFIIYHL